MSILVRNGFKEVRSGPHTTFKRLAGSGKVPTTFVPHHKEITIFSMGYIMKQTGKPREEFER
ncbi:type II toxin-antitoxin system HicA family toxin [Candidatus Micrarchaeota archaeon]|nr:type II toxin-antitoxin system HicA family toxin [Candidatus Micrarchaeota archaeon]